MSLVILILVGAMFGWLATIVLRIEEGRGILANALIGVLGSLVAGLIAGSGTFLGGISGIALMWAVAGSVIAIVAFNLVRQRSYR